jgi:hypothetical protein
LEEYAGEGEREGIEQTDMTLEVANSFNFAYSGSGMEYWWVCCVVWQIYQL